MTEENQTPLSDMLGAETDTPVVETPPEAQEAPSDDGRARDPETGKFVKKEEAEEKPSENIPEGALMGERKRRQEAEQRLASIEQELKTLKNPPAPPPSIWEDEGKWQQHFGDNVVSVAVREASLNTALNLSEMMTRREHDDFDDMKAKFLELATQNPELRQAALSDADPWRKAYQIAKNHETMRELGAVDMAGLKEQLRKEIMAERQQPPGLPPTLSTERNVGQRTGPAWSGPTPLSDLLR